MQIITLDFESLYDKQYSLSKMSTAAYIQDERFEVIGVAVKINNEPTEWFSGTEKATREWLLKFDWGNAAVCCHNSVFDCTILSYRFGIKPKLILDTLAMARAVHGTEVGGSLAALVKHYNLGEKGTEVVNALGKRRCDFTKEELDAYASYCINDVDLTRGLFEKLKHHFNKTEIQLIDMTVRMHSEPMLMLDRGILEASLVEIQQNKEAALLEAGVEKAELMSNPRFAEILRGFGVEPPTKISPTTGKETYAFAKKDEGLLALLEHEDIRVQTVVSARLQTKETLEETKTQRLIDVCDRGDTLPVGLKYYGAEVSGRWSAGGDNGGLQLQNVARNSRIKEAIVAPDGYSIVAADLSNIEVRTLLYIAGQQDQLDVIESGRDMYRDFAEKAFGMAYDEVDTHTRYVSKTAVLGLGFGAGAKVLRNAIKLGSGVDLGETEAKRIVDVYREVHFRVVEAWRGAERILEAVRDHEAYSFHPGFLEFRVLGKHGIELPSKLKIKYPNLRQFINDQGKWEWVYDGRRGVKQRMYGPKSVQNLTQATARCIMGESLARINKRYRVALTVHDSVYCVVPTEEASDALAFVFKEMTTPPAWAPGIPLAAEGGIGASLKDAG